MVAKDRMHEPMITPKKYITDRVNDEQRQENDDDLFPFHGRRVESPNAPKLSDCGGRRSLCGKAAGGERSEAAGAQAVTPGAVRCSAWLGVAVI